MRRSLMIGLPILILAFSAGAPAGEPAPATVYNVHSDTVVDAVSDCQNDDIPGARFDSLPFDEGQVIEGYAWRFVEPVELEASFTEEDASEMAYETFMRASLEPGIPFIGWDDLDEEGKKPWRASTRAVLGFGSDAAHGLTASVSSSSPAETSASA